MAEAVKADCETGHIRGIFLMSVGGVCVDCGERWFVGQINRPRRVLLLAAIM